MTIAEMIEEQRRKCEADKQARMSKISVPKQLDHASVPAKVIPVDRERAYIEDRTYDGKVPEGGMAGIMRRENPDEYVARDGTRTFVPWRYVSMQDLELPDGGNPYRKQEHGETMKRPVDPWGRPSGYVGSSSTGMLNGNDRMSASGSVPASSGAQGGGWDDWLAPVTDQQSAPENAVTTPAGAWDSWMAPAPNDAEMQNTVDIGGTLDIMRSMRK